MTKQCGHSGEKQKKKLKFLNCVQKKFYQSIYLKFRQNETLFMFAWKGSFRFCCISVIEGFSGLKVLAKPLFGRQFPKPFKFMS